MNERICDDSLDFNALCKEIDSMTDEEFISYLDKIK